MTKRLVEREVIQNIKIGKMRIIAMGRGGWK